MGRLILLALLCTPLLFGLQGVGAASTTDQCGNDFQKVTDCLQYATGKESTPSKSCCSAVEQIKESDPKCLCFIVEQAHNSSNSIIKSYGIQEAKLIQLPSACQLQNASLSNCPKLLGLSPGSPDIAIFNGSASATPTNMTTGAPATVPASGTAEHGPPSSTSVLVVLVTVVAHVFTIGYTSV